MGCSNRISGSPGAKSFLGATDEKSYSVHLLYVGVAMLPFADGAQAQQSAAKTAFTFEEVMIRTRDGVRLQTVILTPSNQKGLLPILFRRTPYGVPSRAPEQVPPSFKELTQDAYIFVIQNVRGRFKSEGEFKLTSQVDFDRREGDERDDLMPTTKKPE